MDLFSSLAEAGRVLLMIAGLSSPYPQVEIKDIRTIGQPDQVLLSFRLEKVVNDRIAEIIQTGLVTELRFTVVTKTPAGVVYTATNHSRVGYTNGYYTINGQKAAKDSPLDTQLSPTGMMVLTGRSRYSGQKCETVIELSLFAPGYPDFSELWGNRPQVRVTFAP